MTFFAKFFVFLILLKILLVSTQEDNFTFLVTGGYRPRKHTLVKHMVSLRRLESNKFFGSMHFCGGAILSSRTILTAAHCVWDKTSEQKISTSKIRIIAKTPNRLKKTRHTNIIKVEDIFVHPRYDPSGFVNDVAILRLKYPVNEDNDYAQRIQLTDGPPKAGAKCAVVGWGRIFEKGPLAADALYVDIFILKTKLCKAYFRIFMDGMLCAGNLRDPERDVCQGDSGGPLICDGKVTGVVSFGGGCGVMPGGYVDVWHYRNWILTGGKDRTGIKLMIVLLLPLLVWIVT